MAKDPHDPNMTSSQQKKYNDRTSKVKTGLKVAAGVGTAALLGTGAGMLLAKRAANKKAALFDAMKNAPNLARKRFANGASVASSIPKRPKSTINVRNIAMSSRTKPISLASLAGLSTRIVSLAKKDDNDEDDSTMSKAGKVAGAAALGGAGTAGALYARGRFAKPGQGFIPTLNSGASALASDAKKLGKGIKAGAVAAKGGLASAASQAWNAAKKGLKKGAAAAA